MSRSCQACAQPVSAAARFCRFCGAPLATPGLCRDCGATLVSEAHFCHRCGAASVEVARAEKGVIEPEPGVAEPGRVAQPAEDSLASAPTVLLDGRLSEVTLASADAPTCSSCGAEVESWAGFCRFCGQRLDLVRDARGPTEGDGTCGVCGAPTSGGSSLCMPCEQAMGR